MSIVTRFAPSPTGKLHIGNIRAALITWLFARHHQGQFILRVDDTDQERSKEEYVEALQHDLTWLGIDWDRFERQRDRTARYDDAIEKLKADGRLYACYETPEELSLKRKAQLNQGIPPIYDRSALKLTDEQIKAYEAEGRRPHWRFKLNHAPIEWHDLIRGEVKFYGKDLSDPVLIREDGSPLYHICSVIDDIDYGVTHVVRGEDHVSNTACHIQMAEALGGQPQNFAHLALFTAMDGSKLSKRTGALSVEELRDDHGIEPMAINSVLARLGTSDPVEAFQSLQVLTGQFDFGKFSRNAAKFSFEEIERINAKLLHEASFDDVKAYFDEAGLRDVDESFWLAARANITRLKDAELWWRVAKGPVGPVVEADDQAFLAEASALLPQEPWDQETWSAWVKAVKEATGRKGKQLFMPLRQALTGMDHGPELNVLLPLIGFDRAKSRLNGKELEQAA